MEWIEWLLSSVDSGLRNIRLINELESCWLSEYLVEKGSVGLNRSNWKESATSKKCPYIMNDKENMDPKCYL